MPNESNASLAKLLRECAGYVERNEFHPDLYQALGQLHAYAGNRVGKTLAPTKSEEDGSEPDLFPASVSAEFDETEAAANTGKRRENGGGFGFGSLKNKFSKLVVDRGEQDSKSDLENVAKDFNAVSPDTMNHKNNINEVRSGAGDSSNNEWSENHLRMQQTAQSTSSESKPPPLNTAASEPVSKISPSSSATSLTSPTAPRKPAFQRPINPNSNLIANGWIEQHRRSKMRIVWKDILASLVEGRRPGEETTLWIQRQINNPSTNKPELEALHQVPMKWLEDVTYLDFYGDFRFSLKVFNVTEEFVFRTPDVESCRQWVATLQSAREASIGKGGSSGSAPSAPSSANKATNAKHAVETGAGTTAASGGIKMNGSGNVSNGTANSTAFGPAPSPSASRNHQPQTNGTNGNAATNAAASGSPATHTNMTQEQPRMTIKELRAIAHGAGFNTRGMERADLEKIAAYYAPASTSRPPQNAANAPGTAQAADTAAKMEAARKAKEEADRMKQAEALAAQRAAEEKVRKQKEEEERLRLQKEQQEAIRKRQAEQQAAAAAERKKWEDEQRRQKEQWEKQWQQPTSNPQAPQQPQHFFPSQQNSSLGQNPPPPPPPPPTRGASPLRRREPATATTAPPPVPPPVPPPPTQQQQQQRRPHHSSGGNPTSPINTKYATAMAQQPDRSEADEQAAITAIKRNILVHWALMPPQYNMLRPIDQLVSNIHNVFPPAFGVASHDYFSKWKPVSQKDLALSAVMNNSPDEEKLKKAVKKLRFFLHPDRLPRDLNSDQMFMCKMLWDVTSDGWEEFQKQKEDLDWIHG